MREDDEIVAALDEIRTLLNRYAVGPVQYVSELIELYPLDRDRFREAVLAHDVWGGAGSLIDVSINSIRGDDQGKSDARRFWLAIIRLAEGLTDAGLADDRVRERADLLRRVIEGYP